MTNPDQNEPSLFPNRPIRRSLLPYAVIIALYALAVILFASPLFAVLGFEYSALMALALSLLCGIRASRQTPFAGPPDLARSFWKQLRLDLALATIPLVLSILSLVWQANCGFWDGLLFYLEVAYPTAILATAFGYSFAKLFERRAASMWTFVTFWVVTLLLSLLPGYSNPQLFTYGWQYGYFPGFVWDESLQLTNAYLASRFENVLWALFLLSVASELRSEHALGSRRVVAPGLLLVVIILFFSAHDDLHITNSQYEVRQELRQEVRVGRGCWFYIKPGSISAEEIALLEREIGFYRADILSRFALSGTPDPIHIYIYPNSESLYRNIGTRAASIAKPWLGEVHIAYTNLSSLKHELAHVLLREIGNFPFYASWSTGLTEGAAMSVEPRYDGVFTLDEHAARILQLDYAKGVSGVMSFTGFAANASTKSYVLAGSFCRYLLSTYGPRPFDKVYESLDFEKAYHKPLAALETEWKRSLLQYETPLTSADSAHFRFYYDRSSILFEPCLRKVGKWMRRGADAYRDKRFEEARRDYAEALSYGGGLSAFTGLDDALLSLGDYSGALHLLDTVHAGDIWKQRAALRLREGDLRNIQGDTARADSAYRDAIHVKLTDRTFLSAYLDSVLLHSDVAALWRSYLALSYKDDDLQRGQRLAVLARMDSSHVARSGWDATRFALRYLRFGYFLRAGQLQAAVSFDPAHPPAFETSVVTPADSLAMFYVRAQQAQLTGTTVDAALAPPPYRRAATEIAKELQAESVWKHSH